MLEKNNTGYRPDIDGLRAIAVLLVLIFHFDLFSVGGGGGFLGVDVFFVISGFLITRIIYTGLEQEKFSLSNFYIRRIRRLAPALFIVLTGTFLFGCIVLFPEDLKSLSEQILYSQLYLSNIFYWRSINYFGLNAENVLLLHTWSLAVEEQFYIFFPVGLILIYKIGKKWFWYLLSASFVISFLLNLTFVEIKPEATFYLMPTRGWEFLAGSLIIPLTNRLSLILENLLFASLCMIIGLILLLASAFLYNSYIPFPGTYALLPVIGTCLLILGGTCQHNANPVRKLLTSKLFRYVGDISYPLYLVHWPVHVFAATLLTNQYTKGWHFAMFSLSFILASIIFHGLENPIRRMPRLQANGALLKTYFAGLVATVIVVGIVFQSNGLTNRYSADVLRLANFSTDRNSEQERCIFTEGSNLKTKESYCKIGNLNSHPSWVVYGDSHAWAAHDAVNEWLEKRNESGYFTFLHGCIPVAGRSAKNKREEFCAAMNEQVVSFIENDSSLQNIFLISIWRPSPENKNEVKNNLRQTIEKLNQIERSLYIWEPLSTAPFSLPEKLARMKLKGSEFKGWNDTEDRLYYDFFYEAIEEKNDQISNRFESRKVYCTDNDCASMIDGVPLFSDNSHLTHSSNRLWADALARGEFWKNGQVTSNPRRGASHER